MKSLVEQLAEHRLAEKKAHIERIERATVVMQRTVSIGEIVIGGIAIYLSATMLMATIKAHQDARVTEVAHELGALD